jgi:Endoglucanase
MSLTRILHVAALLLSVCACGTTNSPVQEFHFYHAQGTNIVDDQQRPARLRGVAFGNEVWSDARIPKLHHSEEDYARVKAMGMNLVRFYLNYRTLEDDANPYVYLDDGWAWIDNNIAWAKAQGIYLILNIHVPPGGYQSLGDGAALWESEELQNRLIALWKAIAKRYANEPVVFGFDLLNEPGVTQNKQQWQTLAQSITDGIREVNQRHPVIVEKVNSVARTWDVDAELNFVKIRDNNVIYTFHFYSPFDYTHQYAPWIEYSREREGGRWPEPARGNTREALARELDQFVAWGKANDVPLFLGEWGVYKSTFEEDRGGIIWVQDMLELIDERNLINTYHTYHEESFGIFRGDGKLDPENRNRALHDLLVRHYSTKPN